MVEKKEKWARKELEEGEKCNQRRDECGWYRELMTVAD